MSAIGPNSTIVRSCSVHSATDGDLVLGKDFFEVYSGGGKQLQIKMVATKPDFSEGKAIFPSGFELLFFKLDNELSSQLLKVVGDSRTCK